MEYQQRHYSTAGWDFPRTSSSPAINNMMTGTRRASEAGPSFDHPHWRPMWETARPPIPRGIDHDRPSGPVSPPTEAKDQRPTQRLPSLASILNSPPPVSRPPRPSVALAPDHPANPAPRSSSPQFFRDDYHLNPPRTDSVTALTQGPSGPHPAQHHYHEGYPPDTHNPHLQKPSSLHPPPPGPQAVSRRLSLTPGSIPVSQSDTVGSGTPRASPEDLGDLPRNSLKRRAESIRGPPRMTKCVGQKEIAGEGLCWLYEDGSYCRTIIDGERVNPNWGVTKAGRPRKRLAQACLTCREKKIKCEPAYPKCHQCAKSQRICKGGMSQYMGTEIQTNSENTPVHSSTAGASPVDRSSVPSAHEQLPAGEGSDSPKSAKRARTYSVSSGRGYFDYPGSSNSAITPNSEAVDPSERDGLLFHLGWERDPYEGDPKQTMQLLDLYFTHIASATYCMFPRQKFVQWVQTCNTKSQDDRMLVYSVLAMGSTFATDPMLRMLGRHMAEIASHALEKRVGKFSLQLCQSRLMVSLYHWAQGKAGETIAWDMSASAFRAISALSLNTEKGVANFDDDDLAYGFDRPTLEECRRRTFWSGFLMDIQRYNGFCGGTMCVFNHDDIFLRLPCKESEYDRVESVAPRPFFDYDSLLAPGPVALPVTGAMAHLVLISAIWGDVFSTGARAVHRTDSPTYATSYTDFHKQATQRLETWLSNLPPQLRYSPENLDTSIAIGYAGTFISLHALYHTTYIRLNRHTRPSLLPSGAVVGNVQAARRHAQAFLSIMQDLSRSSRSARLSESSTGNNPAEAFNLSTPFPGYAFMTAVDVLSAGGLLSSLPSLISLITVGLSCVEELAEFWASGKAQLKTVRSRVKLLGEVVTGEKPDAVVVSSLGSDKDKAWRLKARLETAIEQEDDTVYGSSTDAFWDGVLKEAATSASG